MNEKTITVFEQVIKSAYDFKSYVYSKNQPIGRAFLYLLLLLAVFGTIDAITFSVRADRAIDEFKVRYQQEFPDFTLTPEGIKITAEMPIVAESKDRKGIYVIDTTGKITKDVLKQYEKGMLVTKKTIYHKRNTLEVREYDVSKIFSIFGAVTKQTLEELFTLKWIIFVFIFIGYYIYFYLAKLFAALLVSLIGLIINSSIKTGSGFEDFYKLSIYALTVPVALSSLQRITGADIPLSSFIFIAVGAVYLGFGLKAVKSEEG